MLEELAFIDNQEQKFSAAWKLLDRRGFQTSIGLRGGFDRYIAGVDEYSEEVSSLFAEIADGLEYVMPDRRLDRSEHAALRKGLRKRVRARDWTSEEVIERFGPPSLKSYRVYHYAGPRGDPGCTLISARGSRALSCATLGFRPNTYLMSWFSLPSAASINGFGN